MGLRGLLRQIPRRLGVANVDAVLGAGFEDAEPFELGRRDRKNVGVFEFGQDAGDGDSGGLRNLGVMT